VHVRNHHGIKSSSWGVCGRKMRAWRWGAWRFSLQSVGKDILMTHVGRMERIGSDYVGVMETCLLESAVSWMGMKECS
jgi:hypothetical protein